MTPLLAASVTGHIHIVEYLIANPDLVSRQERIDALELLGATFVDKKRDMLGSYKLWKRAMEDRYINAMHVGFPVEKLKFSQGSNLLLATKRSLKDLIEFF